MKRVSSLAPAALALGFAWCFAMAPDHATSRVVDWIKVDGAINPAAADFIADSIDQAGLDGAAALVIELDTPGGMLTSTRRIVETILGAPLPVIVYVAPPGASAASAGMFITISAHVAAMAPGTTIGAAHPVELGGGQVSPTMEQKLENFAASFAQSIAQQRGHNEKWAQDAVRKSATLDSSQALAQHVVDIVATDLTDLLGQASGRTVSIGGKKTRLDLQGANVRRMRMTMRQKVLNLLADPNLVYLLLIGGMVGLYFEFAHPGVYLPGVAGAICLLLGMASFEVLPISVAGLMLLLLGIGLLATESFVPAHGVFAVGGVISFVLGSLFLIDRSQTTLAVNRAMIIGTAVALTAIVLGVGVLIARDRRAPARTGLEGLIGAVGDVRDAIAPGTPGRIFVHGETWRAISDRTLAAGTRVRVVAAKGVELEVRPFSTPS